MTTSHDQPGQAPQNHHNRSRPPGFRFTKRRLWTGLSVIAVLGLSAGLIAYAVGGTHQPASASSTSSTSSSGAAGAAVGATASSAGTAPKGGTSATKGKVISAAKLAQKGGALTPPTSMQSHVVSWQSGVGGHDLTTVSARLGAALQAGGIKQYTSMKSACAKLASSVTAAQAGPQIPDAAMQSLYTKALSELAKGAADCQTAISIKATGDETTQANVNMSTLRQATTELSAGATDIFRATAEIEILSRQHH
jgi:hypothetical protein